MKTSKNNIDNNTFLVERFFWKLSLGRNAYKAQLGLKCARSFDGIKMRHDLVFWATFRRKILVRNW